MRCLQVLFEQGHHFVVRLLVWQPELDLYLRPALALRLVTLGFVASCGWPGGMHYLCTAGLWPESIACSCESMLGPLCLRRLQMQGPAVTCMHCMHAHAPVASMSDREHESHCVML